jgi:VWFA-related protein
MRRAAAIGSVVLCAAVLVLASAAPSRSQAQAPPQNPPAFRAGVNLVELEVSVLDRDGTPVTGLSAGDFTVLDNGERRPVAAFSAVELPEVEPTSASWMQSTSPDVASNQLAARRLVVLVFAVKPSPDALRVGHAIVDHLGPADLASVMFLHRADAGQAFTTDRALLDQAIDGVQDLPSVPFRPVRFPLDRLTELVESLEKTQSLRKVVFVVSGDGLIGALSERDRLYRAAERANVNINCLTLGLSVEVNLQSFCKEIASNTNGTAVTDRNDPETQVPALLRAEQSYYLIGFEPTGVAQDGKRRRLEVKVDRPGVEVRTRSQYTPSSASAVPDLDGPLPVGSVPLQIAAFPVAGGTKAGWPVVIALTVGQPNVRSDVLRVDIRTYTSDDIQEMAGQESVRWTPRAAPGESRQGTIFARVDLAPGLHHIRAAVRSAALKQTGSVFTDVDVPDFAKARLSLSGVVLHSDQAETLGGTETLRALVPSVPTTRRTFAASEHVTAALAIYEGGSTPAGAVVLTTQITDEHDHTVFEHIDTLAADRFSAIGRHGESTVSLPLDQLPAGRYLLSFEATTGTDHAERDVQFAVK